MYLYLQQRQAIRSNRAVEPPQLLPRHTSSWRQLSTTAGEDGAEEEVEDHPELVADKDKEEEADEDNDRCMTLGQDSETNLHIALLVRMMKKTAWMRMMMKQRMTLPPAKTYRSFSLAVSNCLFSLPPHTTSSDVCPSLAPRIQCCCALLVLQQVSNIYSLLKLSPPLSFSTIAAFPQYWFAESYRQ